MKRKTNISFSPYKDYKNLTTNDFSEEAQDLWDKVVKDFKVTNRRVKTTELESFDKVYIYHFAAKESDEKRGNHFYSTYQIVRPCSNISHDRTFNLYCDRNLKVIILEKYDIKGWGTDPITEDILKEASRKEASYCCLDDHLLNRRSGWLEEYDSFLGLDGGKKKCRMI